MNQNLLWCWIITLFFVFGSGVIIFTIAASTDEYNSKFENATCKIEKISTTERCSRFNEQTGVCRYNNTYLLIDYSVQTKTKVFGQQQVTDGTAANYNKNVRFVQKIGIEKTFDCFWNGEKFIFEKEPVALLFGIGTGLLTAVFINIFIVIVLSITNCFQKCKQNVQSDEIVMERSDTSESASIAEHDSVKNTKSQQNGHSNDDIELGNANSEDQPHYCAICINTFVGKFVESKCNHYFHKICLEKWLEKDNVCPMCKSKPFRLKRKRRSKKEKL